jgi:selenocysteine-specific elongation factor
MATSDAGPTAVNTFEAAPSLVLGTAGHIDHGKSTLVKALTGTDPDRLEEEKRRGITIELGFARLVLPSGRVLGIVDVPGHEKFVRQMVAGATGIDLVLLAVAADDGVMPQTREHLAIVDLLGIEHGVVAVTKADLADPDWLALVEADVRELLAGTALADAPIVPVSARTGDGLPELLTALDEVAAVTESRHSDLPARLPVDRVFTIAGAGTVVTGTLWSGRIERDDTLQALPSGSVARVRGLQVHGEPVPEVVAGQRAAVNLAGLDKSDVDRGDILAVPGTLDVTDRFDAKFTYLGSPDGKPLTSGTRVHISHGTRDVLGTVLLMDDVRELAPGASAWAQIRLDKPLAPRYGDRFIVRSNSGDYTLGGGEVLDVLPPRRTTLTPHERVLLTALAEGDVPTAAVGLLTSRGMPMTSSQVAAALGVARADVADALNTDAGVKRLKVGSDTYFVEDGALTRLLDGISREVAAFHAAEPAATGLATGALRDVVDPRVPARVFDAALTLAVDRRVVEVDRGMVRDPKAAASAIAAEAAAASAIAELLRDQGLAPASPAELAAAAGHDLGLTRKALNTLADGGDVVRVASDLFFDAGAVAAAQLAIETHIRASGPVLAKDARDILGTSRKYVVPLLEYFDARGVTRRDGDVRTLRAK